MLKNAKLSFSVESGRIQDDPDLTTLDREIRDKFKDIDDDQWESLRSVADKNGLGDVFEKIFKQKKDYDEGRQLSENERRKKRRNYQRVRRLNEDVIFEF